MDNKNQNQNPVSYTHLGLDLDDVCRAGNVERNSRRYDDSFAGMDQLKLLSAIDRMTEKTVGVVLRK